MSFSQGRKVRLKDQRADARPVAVEVTVGLPYILVASVDATAAMQAIADYVCDGLTDDVIIQAAIDEAETSWGKVVFTEGGFYPNAQLNTNGVVLQGNTSTGAGFATEFYLTSTGISGNNLVVSDIQFWDYSGGALAAIRSFGNSIIERCRFEAVDAAGVYCDIGEDVIRDCFFESWGDAGAYGVWVDFGVGVTISGCTFTTNAGASSTTHLVYLNSDTGSVVSGCYFETLGPGNIGDFTGGSWGVYCDGSLGSVIADCTTADNNGRFVKTTGGNGVRVAGLAGPTNYLVEIDSGTHMTVTGCIMPGDSYPGPVGGSIDVTGVSQNTMLTGNNMGASNATITIASGCGYTGVDANFLDNGLSGFTDSSATTMRGTNYSSGGTW